MHVPTPDLTSLLFPRAVAVVGASDTAGSPGTIVFDQLVRSGIPTYPVHPHKETLAGRRVYPTVEELPDGVDVAVIAIAAARAVAVAEACAARGVPFIVVLAGGFAEAGADGRELEARLRRIPAQRGSRILGPNTLGLFVPENGLDTIFVEHGDTALAGGGSVSFVTQSGSVGVEALGLASNAGFGMRAFVGLGNKSDLNELDFLRYFDADAASRCLAFYVESLEDGRRFLEEARRTTKEKPVVLLKAGRTDAGASAVVSHTGRLAGSDQVVSGAFKQYGIHRAVDEEELTDAAKALAMAPPAKGNRVAVITPAGGYGVMSVDYIEEPRRGVPLRVARLAPETQDRIREATFPFASVRNPVDLTAGASDDMFGHALDEVLADDGVDLVLCIAFFSPALLTEDLVDVIARRVRATEKPVLVVTQYGPFTDEYLRRFYDAGVLGFPSVHRAVRAARILVERSIIENASGQAPGRADPRIRNGFREWHGTLRVPGRPDEYEAKQLLAGMGISVPAGVRLLPQERRRDPIWVLARLSFPPPYVVKVCTPDVLHKTDRGGVFLNQTAETVAQTMDRIWREYPQAAVLVEQQLSFSAHELIVGAIRDPQLGPAVMVGAGGVLTEVYRDVSFRLAPLSQAEAQRMLDELILAPVFDGFRGIQVDRNALAAVIAAIGRLAADAEPGIEQLDVNPIVFSGGVWHALDAKIVLQGA